MADFEEHWKLWRYAFAPNDTNAKRVVLDAFNKGRSELARELYDYLQSNEYATTGHNENRSHPGIFRIIEGYLPVEE